MFSGCIFSIEVVYFVHTGYTGVLSGTGAVPIGNSAAQFHFSFADRQQNMQETIRILARSVYIVQFCV